MTGQMGLPAGVPRRSYPAMAVPGKHRFRRRFTVEIGSVLTLGIVRSETAGYQYLVGPTGLGVARRAGLYPMSEDGWRSAWAHFANGDPAAALRYERRLTAYQLRVAADRQREAQQEVARRAEHERQAETARVWAAAAAEKARKLEVLQRSSTFATVTACTLQAGYGLEPLQIGSQYDLYFAVDRLCVTDSRQADVLVEMVYSDVIVVQLAGPGKVTTGGGFVGGGFGVKGALEGMAIASVLNALTTRTNILTLIELQDTKRDLILSNTSVTPDELRLILMPVYAKLRHVSDAGHTKASAVEQLQQLSELRSTGILTPEEFENAKRAILRSM